WPKATAGRRRRRGTPPRLVNRLAPANWTYQAPVGFPHWGLILRRSRTSYRLLRSPFRGKLVNVPFYHPFYPRSDPCRPTCQTVSVPGPLLWRLNPLTPRQLHRHGDQRALAARGIRAAVQRQPGEGEASSGFPVQRSIGVEERRGTNCAPARERTRQ